MKHTCRGTYKTCDKEYCGNCQIEEAVERTIEKNAAGGYAIQHDWRKMLYWFFCACIQGSVTY